MLGVLWYSRYLGVPLGSCYAGWGSRMKHNLSKLSMEVELSDWTWVMCATNEFRRTSLRTSWKTSWGHHWSPSPLSKGQAQPSAPSTVANKARSKNWLQRVEQFPRLFHKHVTNSSHVNKGCAKADRETTNKNFHVQWLQPEGLGNGKYDLQICPNETMKVVYYVLTELTQ